MGVMGGNSSSEVLVASVDIGLVEMAKREWRNVSPGGTNPDNVRERKERRVFLQSDPSVCRRQMEVESNLHVVEVSFKRCSKPIKAFDRGVSCDRTLSALTERYHRNLILGRVQH